MSENEFATLFFQIFFTAGILGFFVGLVYSVWGNGK